MCIRDRSCADSKDTITIDGQEYPLIKREISSTSHPFYTGKMKLVDTAGRVDKFYKKFGKSSLTASDKSPSVDEAVAETLSVEESVSEKPSVDEAVAETPSAEESVSEAPSVDESVAESPSSDASKKD